MAPFAQSSVKIGPGTLYAAPIGTTEPAAVTGAWPIGWVPLGYTDNGSQFQTNPTTANVEVEEEIEAIRVVTTSVAHQITFALAEHTARNLLFALNAGVGTAGTGTGLVAGTTGTNPDGSIWVEPPALGEEVRVMLGWDALAEAAATGSDTFGRKVMRQCLQTGNISETHQKGNNKTLYSCTFTLEKPATGLKPFRDIFPVALSG